MTHLILFMQFFKYGLLCLGGGYMIIPLLYEDFVAQTEFFTPAQFGNLLAISQMTPGAVSINAATYIGYMQGQVLDAVIASIGLAMPTFILAIIALSFFKKHQSSTFVTGFFKGARWAAFVMVLSAVVLFANMSVFSQPISLDSLTSFSLKYPELGVAIISAVIYYRGHLSMMQLLVLAFAIGFGVSFI